MAKPSMGDLRDLPLPSCPSPLAPPTHATPACILSMWFVDSGGRPQPARLAPGLAQASFGTFASFGWYLKDCDLYRISEGDSEDAEGDVRWPQGVQPEKSFRSQESDSPIVSEGDNDDEEDDGVFVHFPDCAQPEVDFCPKKWQARSRRGGEDDDEEADSGMGSGGEASLGFVAPPSPPPPPPPRHLLRRHSTMLRAEEKAALLRETATARLLHGRVDELRAGASELRRAAHDLREEMEESDAHARSLVCYARQLAEEMREVQHLDSLLLWLSGPMPDVAIPALPDEDVDNAVDPLLRPLSRSSDSEEAADGRPSCSTPHQQIYSV